MIAETDSEAIGRRHAAEMAPDIGWTGALDNLDRWQGAIMCSRARLWYDGDVDTYAARR
jgi:hypothetical protein